MEVPWRVGALGLAAIVLVVFGRVGLAAAGTTGTITGTVTDPSGAPIVAVTVRLEGTPFGAYTDEAGNYTILRVGPGTYELLFKRLGFETNRVQGVEVSADQRTRMDIVMKDVAIQVDEVVVTAERPPVDLNLTSTKATVNSKKIEELPVQDLDDIVNLQAGVVKGHFRGGRQGEVQYQVDGVSVNNAFDNKSSLKLDRSLLQEVQVISGTFDAEYGQAMSGVVNAVLKEGTPTFEWSGEAYTGDFVYPGAKGRIVENRLDLGAIQNYQLTLRGPSPLPDTLFLLSGRRYVFDDYVWAERRFLPTDDSDFETREFKPTGNDERVPLGFSREWSGVAKVTNSSFAHTKLNYQILVNDTKGRRTNFAFRYLPDGATKQHTRSISHGLDLTQTLGPNTFVDFSFRQNYRKYTDWAYEDAYDPRYDAARNLRSDQAYEIGAFIQGVDFARFKQLTNSFVFKSSITSQLNSAHQAKFGGELEMPKVEFGTPGYLVFNQEGGGETLQRRFDEPPDFPGVQTYYPLIGALFAQDNVEFPDLTVRAGLRLDYFDSRTTMPSDLKNPANAIANAPLSNDVSTGQKVALSPRLGVAYPIEDTAAIHFAYGHFRQFPAIGTMLTNANYDVLSNLQASDPFKFGVLGNPDLEPEKTVQYEVGYKQAITADLGVDLTAYYKDVRDLVGVEFITTYTGAQYPRLTNVDFGNILGFTLAIDHRALGPASVSLDYTWQQALGNSSNPRETADRAQAGEDSRPRLLPFNWDQRHTLNLTVSVGDPLGGQASAIVRASSGQPYTPVLDSGFDASLATNSGRRPSSLTVDLRAERSIQAKGQRFHVFGRVFNVFDSRFSNGFVFNSTGSPYYSRFPVADEATLRDPTRFLPPRRIELGIRFGS